MPYSDPDKRKEATKERVRRYRERLVTPTTVTPGDVTPSWETIGEKVRQHDAGNHQDFTPEELVIILQWGIDTKRIRAREDVVTAYDLAQPDPRYGPDKLAKEQVRDKINAELRAKKIDTQVMFLCGQASGQIYDYSKDWYR